MKKILGIVVFVLITLLGLVVFISYHSIKISNSFQSSIYSRVNWDKNLEEIKKDNQRAKEKNSNALNIEEIEKYEEDLKNMEKELETLVKNQ